MSNKENDIILEGLIEDLADAKEVFENDMKAMRIEMSNVESSCGRVEEIKKAIRELTH